MVRKGIQAVPIARSTSSVRDQRREQPPPPEPHDHGSDQIPPDTLLAAWKAVFPLSHGPTHRVRLHTGPSGSAELVRAIAADYVRELSERLPSGSRINTDGDLLGAPDFDGAPRDVLFKAVFTTDLEAIVRRHSRPEPPQPHAERGHPSPALRSTAD
jgi:hypothetical protein